jgi:1-phosphatidylinositol-4-phosphate 5-kinase
MAKPEKDLVDSDFTASHKLAFDAQGKELIPTSKYHFKFKDYAPWAFRHIREAFKIVQKDYLSSIYANGLIHRSDW